jgi:hypothetical protein
MRAEQTTHVSNGKGDGFLGDCWSCDEVFHLLQTFRVVRREAGEVFVRL